MGWASGSYLAEGIWADIKDYIPEDKKQKVASDIYNAFCGMDADDWEWSEGSLAAVGDPEEWEEIKAEMEENN